MNLSKEDREFLKKVCEDNSSNVKLELDKILKLMHTVDERIDQGSIRGIKKQLESILFKNINDH